MNFESGKFFNIYKVGEKLGHGHFAEVKHCIDKTDEKEYAAKFIRLRQLLDAKNCGMSIEEIEREAHILKMLNHQNIIKLFYCYDLGKHVVLLLELVAGGELFDHISDSEKLSEEEASEFIEQILLGVQHMHERKVVHLDLKPENVMIEDLEERKIKLIDFGLAREIKKVDTIIEMQGTAEFLAPEVINYNPISYATDMWAIGVISYIMLTGVSPFSGDDQFSTFQNIVNCRLDFEEDVCSDMSEMAKSFITSLLVVNTRIRATANSCLLHRWIKPMEQATVFRRRSSIISRDKLQSLKQFVVFPSPPSSEAVTPRLIRRSVQENDLFEDLEDSWSGKNDDDDLVLLNQISTGRTSTLEPIPNINASAICENDAQHSIKNDSDIKIENGEMETDKTDCVLEINSTKNLIDEVYVNNSLVNINDASCTEDDKNGNGDYESKKNETIHKNKENELAEYKDVIQNNNKNMFTLDVIKDKKFNDNIEKNNFFEENSSKTSENSMSQDSLNNSPNNDIVHSTSNDPVIVENSLKQKFNNTIANSVRKLNSKFESITSLFDTKTKSNSSSFNINKRRGSLKTSLNINAGHFMSSSDRNRQLFSVLSTERSTSYDETVKYNSKPVSASVATSPTVFKKSVFISRYMAHIEGKKN